MILSTLTKELYYLMSILVIKIKGEFSDTLEILNTFIMNKYMEKSLEC
jgi:hypothetical protein